MTNPPPTKPISKQQGYRYYDTDERPHVHTLGDAPLMGCSTVCSILAKPLTWWASGMAVAKMGWIYSKRKVSGSYVFNSKEKRLETAQVVLSRLQGMPVEGYLSLLDEAYAAHNEVKDAAAVKGTAQHKLLEEYIRPCLQLNAGVPVPYNGDDLKVKEFVAWAQEHIQRFLWAEIHCYSQVTHTGGIADVGWLDKENRIIAGDFKSSKDAYFDQFIQVAGYDLMLSENGGFTADGEHIFTMPGVVQGYCIIPFGQTILKPELIYDAASYRTAFPAVVQLYKLKQAYDKSD